jgi:hypothetical protein
MNNTDTEFKIVFGHKPPMFDVPTDWKILTTDKKISNEKSFFVNDDSMWKNDNNSDVLSEWSYLIPLAKKLKTMPEIKTIRLAQYRKIVSNVKIKNAIQDAKQFLNKKEDLMSYDINNITQAGNSNYLISQAYEIYYFDTIQRTVLSQYQAAHHIEDLLRFTADAIACGEISELDANLFLHMNKFIIGGMGLGVFPAANFIKHIEKLEKIVSFHYVNKWKKRSDSYQYRNLGFCMERMSSYLLFNELSELGIKWKSVLGNMVIISNENVYQRGTKSI